MVNITAGPRRRLYCSVGRRFGRIGCRSEPAGKTLGHWLPTRTEILDIKWSDHLRVAPGITYGTLKSILRTRRNMQRTAASYDTVAPPSGVSVWSVFASPRLSNTDSESDSVARSSCWFPPAFESTTADILTTRMTTAFAVVADSLRPIAVAQ
jgi:hypothetical protein